MRKEFTVFIILCIAGLTALFFYDYTALFWILAIVIVPMLFVSWWDMFQAKHTIKLNFSILGRLRYVMKDLRPKIYQRAELENSTSLFGTQLVQEILFK